MNLEEGVSRNTRSHIFIHIFLPYICILEWLYVEGTLELRLDSLSTSRRHSANADVIADVKSKIIVSRRHFFVDVIFSATSQKFKTIKIKPEKIPLYTQTNTCFLHISRNFKDIFRCICFTLYL